LKRGSWGAKENGGRSRGELKLGLSKSMKGSQERETSKKKIAISGGERSGAFRMRGQTQGRRLGFSREPSGGLGPRQKSS